MKVYIGSSFSLIDKVEQVADLVESFGHEITEKWWKRVYQVEGLGKTQTNNLKKVYDGLTWDEFFAKSETSASFIKDFHGVKNADAMIFVADDKPRKFNGASIEAGIAIGDDKPVYLLGELQTSVMFASMIKCVDKMELIGRLQRLQKRLKVSDIE